MGGAGTPVGTEAMGLANSDCGCKMPKSYDLTRLVPQWGLLAIAILSWLHASA